MATREKILKERVKLEKAAQKRYNENKAAGLYGLAENESGKYIELSDQEAEGRYFDLKRLAATLKISEADCNLLKSIGKTYVFAKTDSGKFLMLYHACLDWNPLCIWVSEATPDQIVEFTKNWGEHGRYAPLLGQTENANHFVC